MHVYADFVENFMAMPVVKGVKLPERFAGALETFCIEALMQDGKALQAGTSHFLGQNLPKLSTLLSWINPISWIMAGKLLGCFYATDGCFDHDPLR